jgi:hypothetical protein
MDLAMVKQEHGETLRQYMQCFFDKRTIVVDVTDKEVIYFFPRWTLPQSHLRRLRSPPPEFYH